VGAGEWGGWVCSPPVHVPFDGSTERARQALRQVRQQGGSGSVAQLLSLVAERIVCAVVAAATAAPAVMISVGGMKNGSS
jgi:hypothetical protein